MNIAEKAVLIHPPTMRGEKVYEQELDLNGVTDYGVSMDALLSGKEAVPLQGARFDLAVDGRSMGRVAGGRTAPTICESALMGAWSSTCI